MRTKKTFKIGERVTFNGGFPGTIVEHYSDNMWVVRGVRGSTCIASEDIEKLPEAR